MNIDEEDDGRVEVIARGVCVMAGKMLLCRGIGATISYLPGGHIEFGETGRQALEREVLEEMGVVAHAGRFLGVCEHQFMQKGRAHAEINLVYEMTVADVDPATQPHACEDWISFEWCALDALDSAGLMPAIFRTLGRGNSLPDMPFEK